MTKGSIAPITVGLNDRKGQKINKTQLDIIRGTQLPTNQNNMCKSDFNEEKDLIPIQFKDLVDHSMVGVYVIQHGRFAYVNSRFANIFGYRVEDMLQSFPVENIVYEPDRTITTEHIKARMSGEIVNAHYEVRGQHTSGAVIWIEVFGSRTIYKGVPAIVGSLLDITTRKEAEIALVKRDAENKERVKELTCMYQLSELVNNPANSIENILDQCAAILPASYQFPEITCVRISCGGYEAKSKDFVETRWKQEACITLNEMNIGNVEVYYKEQRPEEAEGPFLKEERFLINSIVDILSNSLKRKKAEAEISKLTRLYHFKSCVNEVMLKSVDEGEIFSKICQIAVDAGNVEMAWIGIYNEEQDLWIPAYWAGNEAGYLQKIKISGKNISIGRGPSGKAIRTLNYHYCNDIENDPDMYPWKEEALKRNYRSSISLPIIVNKKLVAVFALYMPKREFFNQTEIQLLVNITDNITFGLDKIRVANLHKKSECELRKAEAIKQAMLNAFPDKIFRINRKGEILYYHTLDKNQLFSDSEKIIGNKVTNLLPHKQAIMILQSISQAFETGKLVTVEYNLHIKGRKRFLEGRIMIMDNEECLFVVRDVTEARESEIALNKSIIAIQKNIESRKKAEAELAESEQKFRSLVEQSLVGVFILQDEKFIYVNPGFETVTGYSKDVLLDSFRFSDLIHHDDLERVEQKYADRISGKNPADHYLLKSIRSDGEIRQIEIISSQFIFKHQPAIIGTVIDVTDKLEKERKLNKAVIQAQENERLQIGMELHDNVKQILAASKLHLDLAQRNIHDQVLTGEILGNIQTYISEAIDELRRLSHQLAPSVDSRATLTDKVNSLLRDMQMRDKLEVKMDIQEFEPPMNSTIQLTIYRILQEQFTNVLKYSKATKLKISIHEAGPKIVMSVADNGNGFDSNKVCDGIGLENIRRRAQLCNGRVEIDSSPGNGCQVMVELYKHNLN